MRFWLSAGTDARRNQRNLENPRGIASSLNNLGAHEQGELEEARQLYSESLEIEKKLGNQRGAQAPRARVISAASQQSRR
jgi:hypothetical protein